MLKMFKRYELEEKDWIKIYKYCKNKKIIFFSTPQNISDLNFLKKNFKLPAIKVGSDDFVNIPLIKSYLRSGIPLILSTGMADLNDFKRILNIKDINKSKIIFLLCTSEYPCKHENVNIRKLKSLKKIIKKSHLIGFSDHTIDNTSSVLSISEGCCFFEKHFTLSNNMEGPDHWFSLNPQNLKLWVKSIRDAYICMGKEDLVPTINEKKNKKFFQRRIVAVKKIKKGDVIKKDQIAYLRVSDEKALPPYQENKILGKKSKYNFKPGQILKI